MDSGAGIRSGAPPALRCSRGFTLSELMISMVLGLFLVGGVLSVFLSGMETQRLNSATARMQESARFALEVLRRDIRQAGFYGCASGSVLNNSLVGMGVVNNLAPDGTGEHAFEDDFSEAIRGFSSPEVGGSTWSPDWSLEGAGSLIVNPLTPTLARQSSDILVLVNVEDQNVQVRRHPALPSASLLVTLPNDLQPSDRVMVTDCERATIFQITAGNPDTSGQVPHNTGWGVPGNADPRLTRDGRTYHGTDDGPSKPPAQIMRIERVAYFLAPSSIPGRTALFRNDQEIALDVESLRFEYGVAAAADPLRTITAWVPADQVVDGSGRTWTEVMAVRATLMLSSGADDNLSEVANTDGLGDDRRVYRTYTVTVGIRNRLLISDAI